MKKILPIVLCASALTGCQSSPQFSVEGNVKGGADNTLVLERLDPHAGWVTIDSVHTGADGDFSISAAAPEVPDLYRIGLNGAYIYLPVDSIDNLVLKADAADFANKFTLSGSQQAEQLTAFEHEAARVMPLNNPDSTEAFRKRVYAQYLQNAKGNILSYYILTRQFNGEYLIDFTHPFYTAVATAFSTFRPDDPHTKTLSDRAMQGQSERRKEMGRQTVIEAEETAMLEISLPGVDGKNVNLSSLLGRGKPVIVAFSALTLDDSPAINKGLHELYTKSGVDIYQVCLDADQYAWKQAAKALPWTVVYDPDGTSSRIALTYNVSVIPCFYIYNSKGELVQSTTDLNAIPSLL